MNPTRFLAHDAADAVRQVRSRLGADAVVLSVAQVPASGVSRLWRKPRLEVLAHLPEPAAAATLHGQAPIPSGAQLDQLDSDDSMCLGSEATPNAADPEASGAAGSWRSGAVLSRMGLQPLHVERLIERAQSQHGRTPPVTLARELALVCAALASFWHPVTDTHDRSTRIHVFVGPPGSGKTTALCKWLAKSVLADGATARAWRLDGRAAHFPGLLDMYGEILGVPIVREWTADQRLEGFGAGFVDLPGVNAHDLAAIRQLHERVKAIPGAQVHLVLNAAYDMEVTLAQVRAFAALPLSDVIFTHTDEEKRLVKLWNFVLGTNFSLRFLSGGQNIPGEFLAATPELLIPRQIGRSGAE
jgi:flagellar biosynthesis protein FlhF